jgi:hypothetical protein
VASFTAFFDANVLYGSTIRNLVMHLALTGLFRAKWSDGVHEEWMTRLLENRPDLSREKAGADPNAFGQACGGRSCYRL